MTATIIRTELLKSINKTMTIVVVTPSRVGKLATYRVMFAGVFGDVTLKKEFRDVRQMEKFVARQLSLENEWRVANPTTWCGS